MGAVQIENHRQDALGVVNLLIAKALRAPLWLLISAMLARVLEPSGLGTWSMVLAAATLLNQLLLQWTQSITQRFGRVEWLEHRRLNRTWATRWPWLVAGFASALMLLAMEPFAWTRRFYGLQGGSHWFILPVLVTLWLMAEAQGMQQVRARFSAMAWSPIIADIVLLGTLGLLLAWKAQSGTLALGYSLVVAIAAGLVVWTIWYAREQTSAALSWQRPKLLELKQATLFAAPLIPGFLVGYFAEWCDYFLIRQFYSEHEVGLFHPAYQYLLIMVGLPTALATVLLPRIVASSAGDGGQSIRKLVLRNAPQFTVLWVIPMLFVVAILPAIFSWLFGTRYASSASLLQVLLIAVPGAIVQHVYGLACFVQNRLGVSTLGLFGAKSLVNVVLSLLLLPMMGVTGSAFGAAISYLVLQWLFLIDQSRYLGLRLGTGAFALLAAHVAAVFLAFINGTGARLVFAMFACLLLLLWARKMTLFSSVEISSLIPERLAAFKKPLLFLLCRSN